MNRGAVAFNSHGRRRLTWNVMMALQYCFNRQATRGRSPTV